MNRDRAINKKNEGKRKDESRISEGPFGTIESSGTNNMDSLNTSLTPRTRKRFLANSKQAWE
jgi:hypothetical protein